MITFLIDKDTDMFAVYEYQGTIKEFPLSKLTETLLHYVKEGQLITICCPDLPPTTPIKGDVCKRKDIHICDNCG